LTVDVVAEEIMRDHALSFSNRHMRVYETRWLPPSLYRLGVEQPDLIAPAVPAPLGLAGEQFKVRAAHQPLDQLSYLIGFAAVLPPPINDKLTDVLA
jgi:hypothetical protein